jgi:hypothetical protein
MPSHPLKYTVLTVLTLLLILILIMFHAGSFRFHQWQSAYLEEYFADHPVEATWIGIHTYDDRFPDYSPEAVQARLTRLIENQAELAHIDADRLTTQERIDYQVLENALARQRFELEELREYTWNPLFYTWLVGFGLESLLQYNFATPEQRARSFSGRLDRLPVFLEQAQIQLGGMPVPHLETAIRQCDGLLGMLSEPWQMFDPGLDSGLVEMLRPKTATARVALTRFRGFLENRLENGPHTSFRLGRDLYQKKLALALNEGLSAPEVLARAEAELRFIQGEMFTLAEPLYREWFDEEPELNSHAGELRMVRRVLDRIAEDHVSPEEVVDNVRYTIDALETFIQEKDLLTLDPSKPLVIRETPEYQRGVSIASLQAPGPLEKELKTYYNVSPIPEDWDAARVESFLREYNRIAVQILSIHEALPGHYVQLYYANRHPSLCRAVFGSGVMVEGWAHYCEGMMIAAGLGDGDPRYALVEKKWKLRGIANAIIDQKIHAGTMTEEEAVDFMVTETFQEEAEARAKWRRAQLTSAQLSTYFVGNSLMWDLRRAVESRLGADFDLKSFHEQLLSHGSIPIRFLRRLMLEDSR